jgi:hypothetical protein
MKAYLKPFSRRVRLTVFSQLGAIVLQCGIQMAEGIIMGSTYIPLNSQSPGNEDVRSAFPGLVQSSPEENSC